MLQSYGNKLEYVQIKMEEYKKPVIIFSFIIGIFLILIWISTYNYYYTDKGHCENYMKYNSNLTYGQGEHYFVHGGNCIQYVGTGLGYGEYSVPLEKVNNWIKENPGLT